jgi:hypothetical protein
MVIQLATSEATGEDWLFVPGHGPVTDAAGVRGVRSFFEYVHQVDR